MKVRFLCSLLAIAALAGCSSVSGERNSAIPMFATDPSSAQSADGFVAENDIFHSLPVKAIATVRLEQATEASADFVGRHVAEGTILFQAAGSEGRMFCASSNTDAESPPQYDRLIRVFACFQDTDEDARFDRVFTADGMSTAFPVLAQYRTAWEVLPNPVSYRAAADNSYPAEITMQFVLRRSVPDKNVVFVGQEIGRPGEFETIEYERYALDGNREFEMFGGKFRVSGQTEKGAVVETVRPVPSRPVLLDYTPARTFHVPG